jgi:hypothetical protein
MRWGMPPPRTGGPPVTNVRNTSSPHWRGWLKPENRCLVPANSFAEYAPEPNPETKKKDVVWFALHEDRPLFAFAGVWTEFKGDRGTKSKPVPGPHQVYGFLTTSPNAVEAVSGRCAQDCNARSGQRGPSGSVIKTVSLAPKLTRNHRSKNSVRHLAWHPRLGIIESTR